MSQTTITSFFNSRKRPATDDIFCSKNKKLHLEALEGKLKRKQKTASLSTTNHIRLSDPAKVSSTESLKHNVHLEQTVHQKSVADSSQSSSLEHKKEVFDRKLNATNITKANDTKIKAASLARKELSLGDIRKKLASSSRLAELKAHADRISNGIQQLKATSDIRNLKQFKSIDVEVPTRYNDDEGTTLFSLLYPEVVTGKGKEIQTRTHVYSPSKRSQFQNGLLSPKKEDKNDTANEPKLLMSPRKVFVSPVKSPSKVPAYIRHAALASTSSLPLPHQYRFLAELFRAMETVVSLLHNRNEKITFTKLKPSVQEMLKRNFTEKHLAQIKHLVPDFYNFVVEKRKKLSTTSQKETYEMIVTPNFPNDIKIMNPSVLLERRRFFYDTLLQLTKKHHSQYLLTVDPPMVIPDNKLTRWHPEFELEKVPEVECAKLPELPNAEKYSTAQDVLSKARELFKCNTKMERALEKLAQAKAKGLTEQEKAVTGENGTTMGSQTSQPSTSGLTILNPALRNLPASLLEKVKAKQAAKALEAMTRSTEQEQKYLIYSRLPDLARTLRNIYVTERKNVLALNIILSKLDSSFKANVSASDLQRDIKYITEEVPEWVKLHDVRNTSYLKLDRNADLKVVTSKLEALAEKYKAD